MDYEQNECGINNGVYIYNHVPTLTFCMHIAHMLNDTRIKIQRDQFAVSPAGPGRAFNKG